MALMEKIDEKREEKLAIKELALLLKIEDKMEKDLKVYFETVYKKFANYYKENKRNIDITEFREELERILSKYYKETWGTFKGYLYNDIGLTNEEKTSIDKRLGVALVLFLNETIKSRAKLIDEGTLNITNKAINNSILDDVSDDELESYLISQTEKSHGGRNKSIAQTEVGIAQGSEKHYEAEAVETTIPFVLKKVWNAVLDTKTRPFHSEAHFKYHQKPIHLYEPFVVGGENLMYPKDPSGSARNIVRCRCTAFYLKL